jgi:putative DNA methylase
MTTYRKKLIEVALPLDAINRAARDEKAVPRPGHPQTMHYWWARRPLAAARAVILAQMVDDPSATPDLFPTEQAQDEERQRLFEIIKDLVRWENTTKESVLQQARDEIWQSWRRACDANADHPRAKELFDRHKLPAFHDPFAGGGALPLEAQRLGMESYASDLNPVAVLINKAMIEIPPRFAGRPPINPEARRDKKLFAGEWKGAHGLAEDVRYYGRWMRDEAERRIGHLYPQIEITAEMAKQRPDLKSLMGQKLTAIAWLWARTVRSPNPAFADVDVPLASTFMLSTKPGKEAYVAPVIEPGGYRFTVKMGKPQDAEAANSGTKLARGANFCCVMSGTPISSDYIYAEANAGRMGARLMACVAEGERGRVYLAPTPEQEAAAINARPEWKPEVAMPENPRWFSPPLYGLKTYGDLFTPRQLVALTTFSDLVGEAMRRIQSDALTADVLDDGKSLQDLGTGATAYAEAVGIYLGCALSRLASYNNTICHWNMKGGSVAQIFARQAIPMSWDFIEVSLLQKMSGNWMGGIEWVSDVFANLEASLLVGSASQADATQQTLSCDRLVSTDPPYYDNIGYADLSDFFYVWLRRSLRSVLPGLFDTLAVPKSEELVATPYRHGSKEVAEKFFLDGMTHALHRIAEQAHPSFPVSIYYAFKQSETENSTGTASTGWETFINAVIRAGFEIRGTWPMRTEKQGRMVGNDTNALASSIVLVCRKRDADAKPTTRREFVAALKRELPEALRLLQGGNIAPVDLSQAAIGPGMAVYTRYSRVLDATGKAMSVREALALINQTLDEVLSEQEGDFDAETRWALAWFDQHGFADGEYGMAELLSKAKNTGVDGMRQAGILASKGGKVRLIKPDELPADWDPEVDPRQNVWEMTHHLVRALGSGEPAAAQLVRKLGGKAEVARELAYRLYTVCERKKRAAEALSYNALVQSWPEITRLARESKSAAPQQEEMFENEE